MRLVMYIETDEGEGLTDPVELPIPEVLHTDHTQLQPLSDYGRDMFIRFIRLLTEAEGK